MKLAGREIGSGFRPYFIAEMSGNHNQSLEKALSIVDAAAAAGADALKIQTYTPDTLTIDHREGEFFIADPQSLWKGQSLYELYRTAMTPWEWHEPLMRRCHEKGLTFFSTPFDGTAVDFLERLGTPFYKIASFENNDLPLIRRVAATGKPVIISTGMASLPEIAEAVEAARGAGCKDLVLLKCTSAYPAQAKDSNLRSIPHLRETFKVDVGLSDHTMGGAIPVAAVAMGASVVEKHFTLSRAEGGVDSAFSLEPAEFAAMVRDASMAWEALGSVHYGMTDQEQKSRVYRRSLYVVKDIAEGEQLTSENIRIIRPGFGLAPKYLDVVLGKRASRPLKRGTAMEWGCFF